MKNNIRERCSSCGVFTGKKLHNCEEVIKKISLSLIGNKRHLGHKHSAKSIKKIKEARKRQIITKEHRDKISKKMKGRKLSESHIMSLKNKIFSNEHKRKLKEIANSNPNHGMKGKKQTKKWLEMRKNLVIPKKDTSIEIKIQNFLSLLHIEYLTHKYISEITHSYQCDILIPEQETEGIIIPQKTIIEADGCYWHGCPICKLKVNDNILKQIKKDKIRTQELQEKGFRVIRLWEHEIKNINLDNLKQRFE